MFGEQWFCPAEDEDEKSADAVVDAEIQRNLVEVQGPECCGNLFQMAGHDGMAYLRRVKGRAADGTRSCLWKGTVILSQTLKVHSGQVWMARSAE